MNRRFFLLAGAGGLAACAGPRPQPPLQSAIAPPPNWRGPAAAGPNIGATWWNAFGDPALRKVVEDALAQNNDVAMAVARVEEARAQFRLARAQRLPDVAAGFEGGRERDVNPGFGVPEEQRFGEVALTASWDLDLFGRLRNASKAAKATMLATRDGLAAVRLAVAGSAAQGYVALRALDARLQVAQDTLATRTTALALARRRSTAGYSSSLELHQAEAEYQAAAQLAPSSLLAIRRQEDALSLLLGENPTDIVRGKPIDALMAPTVPAGLPASLLRRRPDVSAAEQQVVAADRSLDLLRATFMPDLSLSGEGGVVVADLIEQNPTAVYTLGSALFAPLLDAGRLKAQQSGAAARRDEAAFKYRQAALAAFRDVEDALAAIDRTGQQAAVLVKERDALSAALDQATRRYRSGYSPYLEQVDAERALLSAELSLVQARADRLAGAIALFQALGGGWADAA